MSNKESAELIIKNNLNQTNDYFTMCGPKIIIPKFYNLSRHNQMFLDNLNYLSYWDLLRTANIMITEKIGFKEAYKKAIY